MPLRSRSQLQNGVAPLLVLAIAAAIAVWAWRSSLPPAARFIAKAGAPVTGAVWSGGVWYWLEGAGTPESRIVHASGADTAPSVSAPEIGSFSVDGGKLAWSQDAGKQWVIVRAAVDGSGAAALWTGDSKPQGLCIADGKVFWMLVVPGPAPDSGPFAPLGSRIRLMSAPVGGGAAALLTEVTEPEPRQMLGVHGGMAYFTISRSSLQDVTALYRCPVAGGAAVRIASESGGQQALLSRSGALYLTGASRESAQPQRASCVQMLLPDGKPKTLQDWMPFGGDLFESGNNVYYIGGRSDVHTAWFIGGADPLPKQVPTPEGYEALAIGGGEMICQINSRKDTMLYRVALQ